MDYVKVGRRVDLYGGLQYWIETACEEFCLPVVVQITVQRWSSLMHLIHWFSCVNMFDVEGRRSSER